MKASVGLHKTRLVDLEQVPHLVSKPEDMQFAQQVADQAITLVRDNRQVLPLAMLPAAASESEIFSAATPPSSQIVAILITDSIHSAEGRNFENALKTRRADATIFYVDNTVAAALSPEILEAVRRAAKVIVAAYIVPVPAKQIMVNGKLENSVGLEQAGGELLRRILDAAAPRTAVIALGSPYVAQNFPNVQTYICTYSNATTSELAAVKVLFGQLQPQGKLPVTLLGIGEKLPKLP